MNEGTHTVQAVHKLHTVHPLNYTYIQMLLKLLKQQLTNVTCLTEVM